MSDIVRLCSSGGEDNYLKPLRALSGSGSTWLLKTSDPYVRKGHTKDCRTYIYPSGGPFIIEGEILRETGTVVDCIKFIPDLGYIITFR